jgi:DNA polymerase I
MENALLPTDNPNKPLLVLVDGHALAYRMYFALEPTRMSTKDNTPTWAVYGFFNALFNLLKTVRPQAIVMTFDVSRESFRTRLYTDYKAHRASMPDDMRVQMTLIRQGIDALNIPVFELDDYEADDLIGTLSLRGRDEGYQVAILTGDQDAFQLVEDGAVTVLLPPRNPRESLRPYNRQAVFDKWGVYPEQVVDFKALKGDTSDNIPGVPGIGDKTAAKFLAQFQTLDNLYANLPFAGTVKMQDKLKQYKDQAFLSQQLALILRDVPITIDWQQCHLSPPNTEDWQAFCQQTEFRSFLQQQAQLFALFQPGDANSEPLKAAEPTQGATLDTLDSAPLTAFTPAYTLVETVDQLAGIVASLKQAGVFAIDVETQGLDVRDNPLIGIALSTAQGLNVTTMVPVNPLKLDAMPATMPCLAAAGDYGDERLYYVPVAHTTGNLPLADVLAVLKPLLEDASVVKLAHNAKFERTVFRQHGIALSGLVFDTMIASYVLRPEGRHGLKALAGNHLGVHMDEYETLVGKGKQHTPFAALPLATAAQYAVCDTAACFRLAHQFVTELAQRPNLTTLLYEVELPLEAVLAEMEWQGIRLDVAYLKGLSTQLADRLAELETALYVHTGGEPFNINSPKQVGEVLFDKLGIQPLKKTATKAFSTDAKVLEQLKGVHPIIDQLLDYRQVYKLKSTYVDALPQLLHPLTGRLHTSFNQTITATGRLSSSNPNLQNIPIRTTLGREIRRAFIPEPGWVLLSADYSQIELRMLAHFSEDPYLTEAFRNNVDIHTATAALVFDVPPDQVTKEQRYRAKTVNFGVIYGQSAHSLSQQLGTTYAEAQQFINLYFMRYSTVKACIEGIQHQAHQTGKVHTLLGRERNLSADLGSRNRSVREFAERAAFNTPLQGSAADLIKLAMIRLHQRLQQTGLKARLLLQVHDEMVLEAPPDEVEQVKALIDWAMALNQPLHVPLVSDIATGSSWLDA